MRDTAGPSGPDLGRIDADLDAMEEFAAYLSTSVAKGYNPVIQNVTAAMAMTLPDPGAAFPELSRFAATHDIVRDTTFANAWNYQNGTEYLAAAAKSVSGEYRGADAFSQATVADVEQGFASNADVLGTRALGTEQS